MATEEPKAIVAEEGTAGATTGSNYASGNKWTCKVCGCVNNIANWKCIACYTSMGKTMQKDKTIRQRNQQNKKKIQQQRQEKRRQAALKANKGSKTPKRAPKSKAKDKKEEDDDDDNKAKDDVKTDKSKEDSKEREIPPYKLSPGIPKTMKALVEEKEGKGFTFKHDYPVPTPKEDELLIRSVRFSICGSDNILYKWTKEAAIIAKLPFIPGLYLSNIICTNLQVIHPCT